MFLFLFPFLFFSYLSLYYRVPSSFFLLPDPVEGVLPLLERLFGEIKNELFFKNEARNLTF